MKNIEILKKQEIKNLTMKEFYDMLTPLIEKGIDGELVAHGFYLTDDVLYEEDDKILFFSVGKNWLEDQEKKRKEKKIKEPTKFQQFIGGFKNRRI